jgi:predicted negative regulator of RcsB-dependent stress response
MLLVLALLALAGGCAKYNTYYNAKRAFDNAERVRDDALRKNQDPPKPAGQQKSDYELAIAKAQKVMDDYPGSGLTDDALFLRAKAYHRLESYRMSIRQFDLLFQNYPATPYLEEAQYLQALNYLLIGGVDRSQDYLGQLERSFPNSRYRAEVSRVSGDNSYTLKDWVAAAAAYRQYLGLGDKARDRDRVSLKLAECDWELHRYGSADSTLATMLAEVAPGELKFRAELLRGRVLTRSGAWDQAGEVLDGLAQAAAFHKSEGDLAIAKAELLMARGDPDGAAAILEGMPTDWQTPIVKARAGDVLGYQHLARSEYEDAYEQFKLALQQRDKLDDPERTRRLSDDLRDYLAAEKDLTDAPAARVPRLKLLQANAMLFGFDRPTQAAALYREAAADSAADSLLAARSLYGMWVAYGQRLDNPDSAALAAAELQRRYPRSAQAREVRADSSGSLFEFLVAERSEAQARHLAGLSEAERKALEEIKVAPAADAGGLAARAARVRRRMVYLARRDNLVFPPPDVVIPLGYRGAVESVANGAPTPAGADLPGGPPAGARAMTAADSLGAPALSGAAADSTAKAAGGEGLAPDGTPAAAPAALTEEQQEQARKDLERQQKEQERKAKRESDPNWDRLREPAPGPRP